MFFTKDDYLKIENWLKSRAVKDSDFKVINSIYGTSDDNYLVILQDNENKRIKIDDFLSDIILQDLGDAVNKTISQKGITDSLTQLTFNIPIEKGTGVDSVIQKSGSNVASGDYSFAVGISTKAIGNTAHSEGNSTTASGENSHAEGLNTTASGDNSHTEGYRSVASGLNSHAEGYNTAANNAYSHSEGGNTISNGKGSHSEGYNTLADNNHSHAEGFETKAYSLGSHAEGYNTKSGLKGSTIGYNYSHAEGHSTEAVAQYSHAEGYKTQTVNSGEHSEGILNKSIVGKTIHTVGIGTTNNKKNAHEIHLDGSHYIFGIGGYEGNNSETEGVKTLQEVITDIPVEKGEGYGSITAKDDTNHTYGKDSVALGHSTIAGNSSKIITDPEDTKRGDEDAGYGAFVSGLSNTASGRASYSEGEGNTASGAQSHAEGNHTTASGKVSHSEGSYTTASGEHSHAEGNYTKALGVRSHAEGNYTTASGEHSHSEGDHTTASNYAAHSEGVRTTASGVGSHVEGIDNKAITRASHAEGLWTKTSNEAEHAQGKYNKSNTGTIHSIGIGTSDSLRKNAVEVMQNGDVYVNGIGGYDGKNSQTEGIKSLQKVVANTVDSNYVDARVKTVNDKVVALDDRTPVDSGIGIDAMIIPEYSTNIQGDLSYYYFSINGNGLESYTQLCNYIIENNLAGKDIYFRLTNMGGEYSKILGHIDINYNICAFGIYTSPDSRSSVNFVGLNITFVKQSDGTYTLIDDGLLVNYDIYNIKGNSDRIATLEARIVELENIIKQITTKE